MTTPRTGRLAGNIITLDEPVPPLEGLRVRVLIDPDEDASDPINAEQAKELWQEWLAHGPQGPLEDDDDGTDLS